MSDAAIGEQVIDLIMSLRQLDEDQKAVVKDLLASQVDYGQWMIGTGPTMPGLLAVHWGEGLRVQLADRGEAKDIAIDPQDYLGPVAEQIGLPLVAIHLEGEFGDGQRASLSRALAVWWLLRPDGFAVERYPVSSMAQQVAESAESGEAGEPAIGFITRDPDLLINGSDADLETDHPQPAFVHWDLGEDQWDDYQRLFQPAVTNFPAWQEITEVMVAGAESAGLPLIGLRMPPMLFHGILVENMLDPTEHDNREGLLVHLAQQLLAEVTDANELPRYAEVTSSE
jgi:hypothetical protein